MLRNLLCLIILFTPAIFAQNGWEVAGRMPYPVYGGEAVVMDSLILILGGTQTPPDQISRVRPTGLIQAYDPKRHAWHILDTLIVPRYGFAADTAGKNGLLICGGSWKNDLGTYTIEKWRYTSPTAVNSEVIYQNDICNRIYFTGHAYKSRFYLFGGMRSPATDISVRFPELIILDLTGNRIIYNSDTMINIHMLPYHHASVRIDRTVYIIGGVYNGISTSILAYNLDNIGPTDPTFTEVGRLSSARAGGRAVALPEYICVLGGYTERNSSLAGTDLISRSSFETREGPALHYARREPMAVVYGDSIYVFGGWNETDSVVAAIERISTDMIPVSIERPDALAEYPDKFELGQNYPNPFNGSTVIPFQLSEAGNIRLEIYNILGEEVYTIHKGTVQPGVHTIFWQGLDENQHPVPSGTYFYRLTNGLEKQTGKMILMR